MSNRIKILFIHRTLRQSGAARQIFSLYKSLDRTLFDPHFAIQTDKHLFYKDPDDTNHFNVLSGSELNIPKTVISLVRVIKQVKPDIIQSFNTDGNLIAYLATRIAPVPYFFASLRNTNKSLLEILVERQINYSYTKLIVNSKAIKNEIIQRCSMDEQKIEIIHNGVNTSLFTRYTLHEMQTLRKQYNLDADTFVVISVGRIARQKNHECTIRALSLFKENLGKNIKAVWFCLGLIEDKRYFQRLQDLIDEYKLQSICRFVKSVTNTEDFYNMADLSILSSSWEGMPNALLESMACARLAIVAESADNDSIVQDRINGLVIPSNDAQTLADRLFSVYSMDRKFKSALEDRARADILQRYSNSAMVNNYQMLYLAYIKDKYPSMDFDSTQIETL